MEIPRYQSRIGVPNAPSPQRLRPSDFGAGVDVSGVAEAFGAVADVLAKQDEADAVSFTTTVSSDASRHFTTRIPELKQSATNNARGFAGTVDNEWDAWIETAVQDAPNEMAAEMARERLNQLRLKSFQSAVNFEAEQLHTGRLSDYDASVDALALSAYNDPANMAKYLAQAQADLTAAESTWMLPATATERRNTSIDKIMHGAIRGLIADNPKEALNKLEAGYFGPGLDANQKASFEVLAKNALQQVENERKARLVEAEKAAAAAEKKAIEETQNDFLARLNDPAQPAPSVREILKSNLAAVGQGSKEDFIKMAQKKMRGDDLNYTHPRKYRDRAAQIADGLIRDPSVLLSDVGSGLSIDAYNKLSADIEKAQTTAGQAELKMKQRAIKYAETQLVGGSFLSGGDAVGEHQLYSFEFELDREIEKGRAEGLTMNVMLDPNHENNIIVPLVDKYRLSPTERLHRQVQELNPPEPAPVPDAVGVSEKPAAPGIEPRRPGESIQQYLERTGRK